MPGEGRRLHVDHERDVVLLVKVDLFSLVPEGPGKTKFEKKLAELFGLGRCEFHEIDPIKPNRIGSRLRTVLLRWSWA